MVSIFPEDKATDMSSGEKISFEVMRKTWATWDDYIAPGSASPLAAPDTPTSAMFLAATSTAAIAVAIATLY